jgi:hypothetical protein
MLTFRGEHFYFWRYFRQHEAMRREVTRQPGYQWPSGFAAEDYPGLARLDEIELYILVLASPFTQTAEGRPFMARAIRIAAQRPAAFFSRLGNQPPTGGRFDCFAGDSRPFAAGVTLGSQTDH